MVKVVHRRMKVITVKSLVEIDKGLNEELDIISEDIPLQIIFMRMIVS